MGDVKRCKDNLILKIELIEIPYFLSVDHNLFFLLLLLFHP